MARRAAGRTHRRRPPGASGLARDEGAQMMLLAAVILVVGFIALAAMVGRVSQLALETGREQQKPLLLEVEPLDHGVDELIGRLKSDFGYKDDTDANRTLYQAAILDGLEHMRRLQASRGLLMEYALTCQTPGDEDTGQVVFSLTDGQLWVELTSVTFKRPSTATPC